MRKRDDKCMVKMYVVQMTKSKIRFIVPVVVLLFLMPAIVWTIVSSGNSSDVRQADIIRQLHVWIPLFSGWWTIIFTTDFFSSDGNELMYLFHRQIYVFAGQLAAMAGYLLLVAGGFCLYGAICPMEEVVLWQLLFESAMVGSLTFFTCFLLQNTGAALMVSVLYCIYLNLFDPLNMFGFLSVFPREMQSAAWDPVLAVKAVAGTIVFLAGGTLLFQVRRVYK